ncbi:MAG TPA: L-aspartate oxidase [Anaerolineae bacterium]|nr:L-aspartate oxidase [Anaerolineae bacterium]
MVETDVLVIGCGIAGATAALRLAQDRQRQVTVITRATEPEESNTLYAQGGIVGRGEADSADLLVKDILAAGAGLTLPQAARVLAEEGPRLVHEILIRQVGIVFDHEPDGSPSYTREAAHSTPRILHVGDTTGKAVIEALIATLRKQANVRLVTQATAVDLITLTHHALDPLAVYEQPVHCAGAYVFDQRERAIHRYLAAATVLATGGIGRIYRITTNPYGARGDGLAMAYRAGARVINAEYVQFHPTTLAVTGAKHFLISEAVRGEGGRLLAPDGRHFMDDYAPRWGDLAPRDVVARAIHHEMMEHGYSHVLLDIASYMPAEKIRARFPTIYERCLEVGVDITRQLIPVVPAAHYFCGGLWVDSWGRTTIKNLYAVGEVTCSGVHGANRLASTSLLEGLVWGERAARHIAAQTGLRPPDPALIPPWEEEGLEAVGDPALIYGDMRTLQNIMWHYVGLARSERRLARAMRDLRNLWEDIDSFYRRTKLSDGLIGLRNACQCGLIVASAARHNRRSRGCHFREDEPDNHLIGRADVAPREADV